MDRVEGEIDFVTALGRLLRSQCLRDEFAKSAESVADQLNVTAQDRSSFVSLDTVQLQSQASGLLSKRWHEIQRLVPVTLKQLGADGFDTFCFYATNVWPTGHQRHVVDALSFMKFLKENEIATPDESEIARMRNQHLRAASPTGKKTLGDLFRK